MAAAASKTPAAAARVLSNDELESALDFELDKSSVLRDKLHGAFDGLSRTFALLEDFRQPAAEEEEFDRPLLFSDFLRQHGELSSAGLSEPGDVESKQNGSAGIPGPQLNLLTKLGFESVAPTVPGVSLWPAGRGVTSVQGQAPSITTSHNTAASAAAAAAAAAASPHPFDKHRRPDSPTRTPPPAPTPAVANVSGAVSVSKLLERLKRTQQQQQQQQQQQLNQQEQS